MATAASPISNALTNPYELATNVDQSNLAASPYMSQLSTLVNSLNQSAQQTANMSRIPGEAGLEQQSSDDISAELAGQLNPGTVSTIQDSMAQLYGGNGFGADNAATSAAAERAMGLTAEGQVQTGETNLSAAAARNPAAPIYDASGLLVTPNQYLAAQQSSAAGSGGGGGVQYAGGGGGGAQNPTQGTQNFGGGSYVNPTTGASGITAVDGQTVTNGVQYNADGSVNYNTPWTYQTPDAGTGTGATLVWSGQDWTDMFGNPTAQGDSGYVNQPAFDATQPASNYTDYYNSGAGVENWGALDPSTYSP